MSNIARPIKALKDVGTVARIDPPTGIRHDELNPVSIAFQVDADPPAGGRVLDGVVGQGQKHLLEIVRVGIQRRRNEVAKRERDAVRGGTNLMIDVPNDLIRPRRLLFQMHARVGSSEVEQPLDQARNTIQLGRDIVELRDTPDLKKATTVAVVGSNSTQFAPPWNALVARTDVS